MRADDQDEIDFLQQEPLLASSTSPTFPGGVSSGSRDEDEADLNRLKRRDFVSFTYTPRERKTSKRPPFGLIIGVIAAFFLLFLAGLSWRQPEYLAQYISDADAEDEAGDHTSPPPQDLDVQTQTQTEAAPQPSSELAHPSSSGHEGHSMIIDYSEYHSFPLDPVDYRTECWKLHQGPHYHYGFWSSGPDGFPDVSSHKQYGPNGGKICSSTITYQLDGYVGLASDLALMAQVAGFARERNRTFFVQDQFWNRGRWTDHFEDVRNGPEPDCLAPPPEELVACPRLARHWILNSRTAKFHMGHEFAEEFEDPYKNGIHRQKPIYERAALSLRSTIRPNVHLTQLIDEARRELYKQGHNYLGVHIRQGDQLASSWKYHLGYVALSEYVTGITNTWKKLTDIGLDAHGPISLWIASDSPAAIEELTGLLPKKTKVMSLARSKNTKLRDLISPGGYIQSEWESRPEEERVRLTQGMIIDLALVSGLWTEFEDDVGPLGVVCTVGSNVCRLSAIGLGWDWAFESEFWVDVDMKGALEPPWEGFRLF